MEKTIDIQKIIQLKMGSKASLVPQCLINWLRKILHEDELNEILWRQRDLYGLPWLESSMKELNLKINIKGMENLPDPNDGRRYTFVSNHPLGGADGITLATILGRHYDSKVRLIVRDELLFIPGLAPMCIGVQKTGKKERQKPYMVDVGFDSENHMFIFPAGMCSRKQNGVIRDLEWKRTFVRKSVETQRDIVPIRFDGENSEKFYRIANICKALHIKFNFAMLYLADEMFKSRGKEVSITIGKPISWESLDDKHTYLEWAQIIKEQVYKL